MRGSLLLTLALAGTACFQTVNIGAKTALERQLMGEFEPLSDEQLLAAAVRGPGAGVEGSVEEAQARALAARRRQLFNRDDLDELKAKGCAGETRSATVIARSCPSDKDPEVTALRATLLAQENEDRAAVVDWVLRNDAQLTPADRPQLVDMYRQLLAQNAKTGDWHEGTDGSWTQK